jgi:hypothetical protein
MIDETKEVNCMVDPELPDLMESPDLFPFVWRIWDTVREI